MKKTRAGQILGLTFLSLFMLACLGYCASALPEEVRMARSNKLDEVVGEVELIIPAERNHHGVYLSPDNRKLLINLGNRVSLLDLENGLEKEPDLECKVYSLRWLDDDHFVIEGNNCYELVDARALSATRIELFPKEQLDGVREVELLRQADRLYALKDLGWSGYTLLALDEEFRYVFRLGRTDAEVEALLAEIPHVAVPEGKKYLAEKCPSPNSEFYAQTFSRDEKAGYVGIFSQDGELLSQAYKEGWSPSVLGWAHDSSGVYFEMQAGGVDGPVIYPWVPIFKLLVPGAVKRGTPAPKYTPTPTSEGGLPGATVLPLETLVP